MKKYLLILLSTFIFSCQTTAPVIETNQSISKFEIEPTYEVLDLRVPLVLPSISRTKYNVTKGTATSSTTITQFHPLCISLGNNLFMDFNGVIFLSVAEEFNLEEKQDYKIIGRQGATGLSSLTIEKNENEYSFSHGSPMNKSSLDVFDAGVTRQLNTMKRTITEIENGYRAEMSNSAAGFGNPEGVQEVRKINDSTIIMYRHKLILNEDRTEITFQPIEPTPNEISSRTIRRLFIGFSILPKKLKLNNGALDVMYSSNPEADSLIRIYKTDTGYRVYRKGSFSYKGSDVIVSKDYLKGKMGMREFSYRLE